MLNKNQLSQIDELMTDHYVKHADDIRVCPKEGCNYAGVILKKSCKENLICKKCNYEWRDPIHYSKWDKLKLRLRNQSELLGDLGSNLRKLLLHEPCPKCGIMIYKNGGCEHMTC